MLALAVVLGTACSGGDDKSAPASGTGTPAAAPAKPLVVLIPADPKSFDPPMPSDGNSLLVTLHLYDRLVDLDDKQRPTFGLAKSWDVSPDNLKYTFHLRPEATFSDGTPVTSKDVKFTFDRVFQKDHPQHFPGMIWSESILGDWFSHIETPDTHTAVFVLKRPFVPMLLNLAMPCSSIVSEAYTVKTGDKMGQQPLGSGPYTLADWKPGAYAKLAAREGHWRGTPKNKTLIFQVQKDANQRISALRRGDAGVDFALDLVALGGKTGDLGKARLAEVPLHSLGFAYFNCAKENLKDKRVRQAMNWAIDRKSICEGLLAGTSIPAGAVLPPGMLGWREKRPMVYGYDPEKAKALMAEAGYTPEKPLKINFHTFDETRPYNVAGSKLAQRLQEDFRKVGIDAKINLMEFGGLIDLVEQRTVHEVANMGWMADTGDPDNFIYELYGLKNNRSNYSNPKAVALMEQAQGELDAAKRQKLYEEAEDLLLDDPPALFINHAMRYVGIANNVKGYTPSPINDYFGEAVVE